MKPNIGTVNALIRITLGLTVVAWSTAKLGQSTQKQSYLWTTFLGAMKVGEGVTKYCPLTDLYQRGKKFQNLDLPSLTKEESPINPNSIY